MSLTGLLTATEKHTHLGQLYMRSIQWHLKNYWKIPESLEKVIPILRSLHQLPETKGSLFGPKRVPRPLREQYNTHSYRQHHSCCLHIQRRGMKSGPQCTLLWRILTWCAREQVTLRGLHILGRLNVVADKLSRLGQTIEIEWSLLPEVCHVICNR